MSKLINDIANELTVIICGKAGVGNGYGHTRSMIYDVIRSKIEILSIERELDKMAYRQLSPEALADYRKHQDARIGHEIGEAIFRRDDLRVINHWDNDFSNVTSYTVMILKPTKENIKND